MWPKLRMSVKDFCKSCITCMRSKTQCHKSYEFLKQVPIEHLPESRGFGSMDQLSKQGIFIATYSDTITSQPLADLFVMLPPSMGYHLTSPHVRSRLRIRLCSLEQYICVFCNYQQDNWLELLPMAEFAYLELEAWLFWGGMELRVSLLRLYLDVGNTATANLLY